MPYSYLRTLGYEVVLVELYCQFKKPCFYDEVLDIYVNLSELNKYFFSFSYQVMVESESRVFGKTKHALLKDGKMISIGGQIKDVLERAARSRP